MDKGANADDMAEYYALVDAAKAETTDIAARYEKFAEAEAYIINKAYIIPFGSTNGGYSASMLDPFSGQYAPFGISNERYKGTVLLDDPMNTDEYFDAYDAWLEERANAQ
jgi:oligopeptide transport system substrate-binding protein